jgi:CarD family transcriptional regulator
MYSVGDKVVHPGYGPGIIKGIERRQVIGEAKDYYIIDILTGDATLMTPVGQADNVGLRPAISDDSVERLFRLLSDAPRELSSDFRERQEEVDERLKEGDIFVTATVLRDMAWYSQGSDLTKRDTQLMQRAEDLVAGELALVRGTDVQGALDFLRDFLAKTTQAPEEEPAASE